MARDRKSCVDGTEGGHAPVALPALPPRPSASGDDRHQLNLFIKALARDLARIDHVRDPT